MLINDSHCHFFSARFFEALGAARKDLAGADRARAVTDTLGWEHPGTPEELADRWVAELDRAGVARAALIASVPDDEASVDAACARHPTRFVGFFMVDPTREDAVGRVERRLADPRPQCVCLFPAMHHYRLDDSRVMAIVEAVAGGASSGAKRAIFVHCGALSVGVRRKLGLPSRFDVRLGDPLGVHVLAARYPSLPFIIPHFGAGFFREALIAADLSSNVYLDTSSSNGWLRYHPGLTLGQVFAQALQVAGPDRLLFGTDSSFFPRGWQRPIYDAQRDILQQIADEDASARILGGNFDRIFR